MIFGLCSLGMLVIMVRVYLRQLRHRRRVESEWQRFSDGLAEARLNEEERQLATEMAAKEVPEEPMSFLSDLETFEKAVQRCLNPLVSFERFEEARELGRRVQEVRRKLGFADRPRRVYSSTRELAPGHRLNLRLQEAGKEARGYAEVASQREDLLELRDLAGVEGLQRGDVVRVEFEGDGRPFAFESRIAQCDPGQGRCCLEHTLDVLACDSREHYRARIFQPVSFRASWEAEDVAREGTLRDLSAGGAAFSGGCFYEEGETVVLRIRPADWLPDSEDLSEAREVAGTILQADLQDGERCIYHVEFRHADRELRQYLFRLVQKLELRARRVGA
jgi:c-di-GMP-binding flagellar brake protein YcgR